VTVLAVVLGACAGALSAAPFFVALRKLRASAPSDDPAGKLGFAGLLLLAVGASVVVLFGSAIACGVLFREMLLPFSVAELVALTASTISFSIWRRAGK
jgi:hypothetical protein